MNRNHGRKTYITLIPRITITLKEMVFAEQAFQDSRKANGGSSVKHREQKQLCENVYYGALKRLYIVLRDELGEK